MVAIPEATIYKEKRMVKHVGNVLKLVNLGKGFTAVLCNYSCDFKVWNDLKIIFLIKNKQKSNEPQHERKRERTWPSRQKDHLRRTNKTCCHTRWLYWLAALEPRGLGSNSSSVFLNKFTDLSDHLFLYTKENLLPCPSDSDVLSPEPKRKPISRKES